MNHSNTTLVKVKSEIAGAIASAVNFNSNTTLVKVKCQ